MNPVKLPESLTMYNGLPLRCKQCGRQYHFVNKHTHLCSCGNGLVGVRPEELEFVMQKKEDCYIL